MPEYRMIRRKMTGEGTFLVTIGQKVKSNDVIAKMKNLSGQLTRVFVSDDICSEPSTLQEKLRVSEGCKVAKGDILAENRHFFTRRVSRSPVPGVVALVSNHLGCIFIRNPLPESTEKEIYITAEALNMNKLKFSDAIRVKQGDIVDQWRILVEVNPPVTAPALGRIREVDMKNGRLILSPLYHRPELVAHVQGVVTAFPEEGVCEIQVYGEELQGAFGYGGESSGTLRVIDCGVKRLTMEALPAELSGKIVVTAGVVAAEALEWMKQQQVLGLICGSLSPTILREFCPQDPLTFLGSRMTMPFPIILMNGWRGAMDKQVWQIFQKHQGALVSVDAETQLRANVIRPRILILLTPPEEGMKP